jgi:hypothetical protein
VQARLDKSAAKAASRANTAAGNLGNIVRARGAAEHLVGLIQDFTYEEGQTGVDWLGGLEDRMDVRTPDAAALNALDQIVAAAGDALTRRQSDLSAIEVERLAVAGGCHEPAVVDVGRITISYCTSEVVPFHQRFSVAHI